MYLIYAIAIALIAGAIAAVIGGQVRKYTPRSGEIRER